MDGFMSPMSYNNYTYIEKERRERERGLST